MNHYFGILVILMLSLSLGGCLELAEITQLKPDGSVEYELRISLPDLPDKDKKKNPDQDVEKDIGSLMAGSNFRGLTPVSKEDRVINGIKVFSLRLRGKSILDLNEMYQSIGKGQGPKVKGEQKVGKEAFDQLFSKSGYKVKKTKSSTLKISRSFQPPKLPKPKKSKKDQEKMGKEFEDMFMNMFRFRFEVFVPTELVQNNAQMVFGNDLRWEATLGYLIEKPMEMEFEIKSTPELENSLK